MTLDRASLRDQRNYRRHLRDLTEAVSAALYAVDVEMHRRAIDVAGRGPRMAKIMNSLNLSNDHARHFGLGTPLSRLHLLHIEKEEHGQHLASGQQTGTP